MDQTLDPKAVQTMKAIGLTENGGRYPASENDYKVRGASGEAGLYQFTQPTWRSYAQQVLGDANADLTPENQNKVAYTKIKQWQDAGYKPEQIASMWNAGEGKPNAYTENYTGTNEKGVSYDTPRYVQNVMKYHTQLENGTIQPPAQQNVAAPQTTGNEPVAEAEPNYLERVGKTIGENVIGAPVKLYNEIRDAQQMAYEGKPGEALIKTGTSIAGRAADALGGLFSFATEAPIAKQVLAGVTGASEALGNKIVESPVGQAITDIPGFQEWANQYPEASKYAIDTINAAGMLVGGKKAFKEGIKVVEPTSKLSEGVEKVVDTGAKAITKPVKFGVSQASGLNPETLSTAFRDPYGLGEAQKSNYSRIDLANEVKAKVDQALEQFSETGKEYDIIRQTPGVVTLPKNIVESVLENYGVEIKNGKLKTTVESTPLSEGDKSALQGFINQYGRETTLSGNGFLNTRKALDNLSKWDATKTDAVERISRDLRRAYDAQGKEQLSGLKELDAKYGPKAEEIRQWKKDLLDKDYNLKDTAISKLTNITGKGKEQFRARMEELLPGISQKASHIKAMEDIAGTQGQKTGAYLRGGLLGGFAGGGNPITAFMGAVAMHPPLIAGIVKALGRANIFLKVSAKTIANIELKLKKGEPLTPQEMGLVEKAMAYANQVKTKIENTPNKEGGFAKNPLVKGFKNEGDLSTKLLGKLEGRTDVSKQYIQDLMKGGDLKGKEIEITQNVLDSMPDKVNIQELANKVKAELLPLKLDKNARAIYDNVTLPEETRGNVAKYEEHIWQSPIKTSAGDVHFSGYKNADNLMPTPQKYFGHTRVEDMSGSETGTKMLSGPKAGVRRVIEVQSDLYQKGNLERELPKEGRTFEEMKQTYKNTGNEMYNMTKSEWEKEYGLESKYAKSKQKREQELSKLQQYTDPTAHFRMVREEVKQAAKDGKTKLQFPTGDTAMKVEGLGDVQTVQSWYSLGSDGKRIVENGTYKKLSTEELKVGSEVTQLGTGHWIITDVLGDGKFKAVRRDIYDGSRMKTSYYQGEKDVNKAIENAKESFDISGKVDTSNPIYKFYESTLGKYLKNKYGAKTITDDKGVTWNEVDLKPEHGIKPVEAFAGTLGMTGLLNQKKEKEETKVITSPFIQKEIEKVQKESTFIPKGYLEAIAMMESSMNTDKTNQFNDAGKFGYIYGITKGTWEDIKKRKHLDDKMLDTVSGATKVASIILQDKAENTSVKYDNKKGITTTTTKILPFDMWLYLNHYSSLQNKTKEEIQTIKEKFPEYVRQYKDSKGLIPLK